MMTQDGNPFSFNTEDPMGKIYAYIFYSLFVFTVILAWKSQPRNDASHSTESNTLKWSFLGIWYICVAGDWLQGPYVYALYSAYGFSRTEISQLFVAGFGASMIFGTCVGSLADKVGRKKICLLYCLLYIASCFTKHFATYWVLMIGRITGGIATSLLFSGFEAWLVAESNARPNINGSALGHIFAMMWFGSSVVAILSGIAGDAVVDIQALTATETASFHYGGYTAPFDLAIVLLSFGFFGISLTWTENYCESSIVLADATLFSKIGEGMRAITQSRQLFSIMIMVACFEGSMYAFVFNWTPALATSYSTPPFGMVFTCFMMAYMCGSSTFEILRSYSVDVIRIISLPYMLGAAAFFLAGSIGMREANSIVSLTATFVSFMLFEFGVGLYFPAISTLKSEAVPESIRSTVYNLYRVPMNGIVVSVLLCHISMQTVFAICFVLQMLAAVAVILHGALSRDLAFEGSRQVAGDKSVEEGKAANGYGTLTRT